MAVTLEISALQYFPWVIAAARKAIAERSLMPGRWIRVRKMKEQEADGDLPAIAAAMQIIGASFVETLDTKGTDGSNIHLAARPRSPATSAGSASPTTTRSSGWTSSSTTTPSTACGRCSTSTPAPSWLGFLLHRLGVDIEFKISVFVGNDNPYRTACGP